MPIPSFRNPRAFTLIEILVVISIIALLAAILFPVFARARENARRASCQSNLKQIALGFKQYIADYDDLYPPTADYGSCNSNPLPRWEMSLLPYTKTFTLYYCPSGSIGPDGSYLTNLTEGVNGTRFDYAYNRNLGYFCSVDVPVRSRPVQESQITFASNTILISDEHNREGLPVADRSEPGGDSIGSTMCFGDSAHPYAPPGLTPAANDYHQLQHGFDIGYNNAQLKKHLSGGNYAFCDGHVKWLPPTKIWDECTPPDLNVATYAYK